MIIRRAAALLCLLAVLVPAAAAQAAPPQSAQRFADAALRLKIAVKALGPAYRTAVEETDMPTCERALERGDVPKRAADRAAGLFTVALIQPLMVVVTPPLQQMVRDLEAIPTSDIALRQGRAAWRKGVEFFTSFPRVEKPCAVLDAWSRAKWSRAETPALPPNIVKQLLAADESDTLDAKFKRAAKRLRQLGISRRAAERFAGDTLFDELDPELFGDLDD